MKKSELRQMKKSELRQIIKEEIEKSLSDGKLKNSPLNEGWMDLLTYGPLAITAALSAFFLATNTSVKDVPSKTKDAVSNFDLKPVLKGIRSKWREYTNPKVFKVIQKMLNDPEIVSAAKTLVLGPRGGKRPDLTNQAYFKALEAKLTPEEMNTLKKFLDKIKKDYKYLQDLYQQDSPFRTPPGPNYDSVKSLRYLKKYASGEKKRYRATDYYWDDDGKRSPFKEGKVSMKKSELRQIIKEEIKKHLNE